MLQLFAHLEGEALDMALLMPKDVREKWEDLSNGLSEYNNSPGRLAVVRRRFKSMIRWPGMDPATFATELGTLAARGFGDMGKRARDAMIRDKFIAAQRHCGLRRHIDGVPPETPIWELPSVGESFGSGAERVHRRYWRTWDWTRVCQSPEWELVQGTVKRMVSWLLYRPYLFW